MPYIESGTVHDADAHIMETAEFLAEFASDKVRQHILGFDGTGSVATSAAELESVLARQRDPGFRTRDADEIMLRKNWAATGALFKEDRPRALDLIGVASQLIFNTFINGHLAHLEKHSDDLDLIYGVADAHNRAMLDFCSVDRRLLATAYVPLADFERTRRTAEAAIRDGFAGLLVPGDLRNDAVCADHPCASHPVGFTLAKEMRPRVED